MIRHRHGVAVVTMAFDRTMCNVQEHKSSWLQVVGSFVWCQLLNYQPVEVSGGFLPLCAKRFCGVRGDPPGSRPC